MVRVERFGDQGDIISVECQSCIPLDGNVVGVASVERWNQALLPCGTPAVAGWLLDVLPSSLTLKVLPWRKVARTSVERDGEAFRL